MAKDNGSKGAGQGRDWSETLFLPKTDFPMRARLPELEPRLLERWARIGLYERLREQAKGRPRLANRVEGRGGVSGQGPREALIRRPRRDQFLPSRMPRLRAALDRRAERGVPAPGRDRRLA